MEIVLLGSGNIATHLGKAFKMAGQNITQVWSRNFDKALELADAVGAAPISSLTNINSKADLYIIAVNDDAIRTIAENLKIEKGTLVHTSGTSGLNILDGVTLNTGVFYPVQTFSKSKPVDLRLVPVAIEGSTTEITDFLVYAASRISEKVISMNSVQRRAVHVAAVFACNFTNHMYALAHELLKEQDLSFDLLRPLIWETALKIQTSDPINVQTGPALRDDKSTIVQHLRLLDNHPELKELYEKLSQSIINYEKINNGLA
ncbi:MAG: DUF2520 domain-containing protein [Flavobacterium sp.]|nr:DUF2520 domain-containing protein [Pedobacter sp.]